MLRRLLLLLSLTTVFSFVLGSVPGLAQQDPLQASTKTVNVELIVDASGSMAELLAGGETRMDAAKRILRQVIEDLPEREGVNVGLRVYGHEGDNTQAGQAVSCRSSELLVPVAGLDKAGLIAQIEAIQPTGWTPIAYSLEQAAADFQLGGESITNTVVLVTDGEETCDPPEQACVAAEALHQAGISVTTHVVGFALTPEQTELVRCVAEEGGGRLFGADNAEELGEALGEALEEAGVSFTPGPVTPGPAAIPLDEIRTLAYHQITAWSTELPGTIRAGFEQAPILSEDGQRIAFGTYPGEGAADPHNRIFVINADGTGQREIDAYPFLCFCPSMIDLSADGSRVLSSDSVQLRIADGNGGGGRELLALDSNAINAMRISADGSTIVFRVSRDATIRDTDPDQPIERGIYAVNPDGSGLRQLVGPTELGSLLGVAAADAPVFSGSSGLDVSANGAQIVFTAFTADIDPATGGGVREGLFAVNGDGSGLRRLLGPTFTFVGANAISGDGSTVAYVTHDFGTDRQEAGILAFAGDGQRTLIDSTTLVPRTGQFLPSGERIQLNPDGSRLLLGNTGLLYDTTSGDVLALGVATAGFSSDPTPLVGNGLFQATMSADATRFIYLMQPEPYQLARLDLNPADLGLAPTIADPSVAPPYVLTERRSTATVSARISTANLIVRVSSRVLRDGLPDDTVATAVLLDDGATAGDAAANDGLFTSNAIAASAGAEVGPRTIRIKAETQAADGLLHATAVDVEPFAVTAEAPPELPPTVTPVPPTNTPIPPTDTPVTPTATPEPTSTPIPTPTPEPTATPLPPTSTPVPTATPSPTPLPTSTPIPTATPVPPTNTPGLPTSTPPPTATPESTPTPEPTATPEPPTPTPVPTATPAVGPTVTPTAVPLITPTPAAGCPCEELAAARATIAAQATRIAELEGQLGIVTPVPPTPGDFITPDLAECTVPPRDLAALQAIAAAPDQAATDALQAAMANPGLVDLPSGQPADAATVQAVAATYRQMTACFNAGRDLAAYALWTDKALRQMQIRPPTTDAAQALPPERQTAVRVVEVRLLPDGRVVAKWEERNALFTNTAVQILVRQGERYLIDETLDLTIG